jgi:hypothetical protein
MGISSPQAMRGSGSSVMMVMMKSVLKRVVRTVWSYCGKWKGGRRVRDRDSNGRGRLEQRKTSTSKMEDRSSRTKSSKEIRTEGCEVWPSHDAARCGTLELMMLAAVGFRDAGRAEDESAVEIQCEELRCGL